MKIQLTVSAMELSAKPSEREILEAFASFTSVPQERKLPSAPKQPVIHWRADRPSRAKTWIGSTG